LEDTKEERIVDVTYMPLAEARGDLQESGEGCVLNAFLSSVLSRYWLQFTNDIAGGFSTMLPIRNAWSDQLLEVTNEGESIFAIGRIKSSLD
jgi:hypothetical protein